MEQTYSYSTSKVLSIIYNFFKKFTPEFRKSLIRYLLGKNFFKLFCHWSYSVRMVFHHFMVLKIKDEFGEFMLNVNTSSIIDLKQQYYKNLNVVKKAEDAKKNEER